MKEEGTAKQMSIKKKKRKGSTHIIPLKITAVTALRTSSEKAPWAKLKCVRSRKTFNAHITVIKKNCTISIPSHTESPNKNTDICIYCIAIYLLSHKFLAQF